MLFDDEKYKDLIRAFHITWDNFPGMARLIRKDNYVLATNKYAEDRGYLPGQICVKMGDPQSHKGCRKVFAITNHIAQVDRPNANKIRLWVPIDDYPDIVVHFSTEIPEVNK